MASSHGRASDGERACRVSRGDKGRNAKQSRANAPLALSLSFASRSRCAVECAGTDALEYATRSTDRSSSFIVSTRRATREGDHRGCNRGCLSACERPRLFFRDEDLAKTEARMVVARRSLAPAPRRACASVAHPKTQRTGGFAVTS